MKRLRRLLVQIALLPILWIVAGVSTSALTVAVAASILVAWPVSIAVAGILVWLVLHAERNRGSAPESLVEAAENAVSLALVESGLAVAAGLSVLRMLGVEISGRPIGVLLAWALIVLGVPSLSWLRTLRDVWIPMLNRKP